MEHTNVFVIMEMKERVKVILFVFNLICNVFRTI